MSRVKREEIERLVGVLDRSIDPLGKLELDYASCYGSYVLVVVGTSGEQNMPFGSKRRSPKQMYECLRFAIDSMVAKAEYRSIRLRQE